MSLEAAIALVNAAPADPAPAPSTPTPSEPAPAPTEAPPSATPTTETPAAPAAPVDETAELMAKLEARKAERAAKQQPSEAAELRAKLAALEAKLSQQPAPATPDLATLVRQHGAVEALRMSGLDPLEFFEQFKVQARDPDAVRRTAAQRAEAERLAKLEEKIESIGKTDEQRRAEAQAQADRDAWTRYVGMVATPESGTPLLAKLPPEERVEQTQKTIAWLERNGHDLDAIDDLSLAKITESRMRQLRDLLAGTDPSVTATRVPAVTDGAEKTSPNASTTTLSNDLASQSTGRTAPLSEKERFKLAVQEVERGS